jgi:hypothetical protein
MSSISSAHEPRPVSISINRWPLKGGGGGGTYFHPARRPQWTSSADFSWRALIGKVSHHFLLLGAAIPHCLRRGWSSSPIFASLSDVAEALCAVLSENLRSPPLVRSKSAATCSRFDGWTMAWRWLGCTQFCVARCEGWSCWTF